MKTLIEYQQQDYIIKFLIGLNDSFSHIRSQILLQDPLPSINKVFSLILQEERQRDVFSSIPSSVESAAFLSRSFSTQQGGNKQIFNKSRPTCSRCGILGHTIDKCYQLHGYPLGFRFNKGKNNPRGANQVNGHVDNENPLDEDKSQIKLDPQLSITQDQIQQLLALLKP